MAEHKFDLFKKTGQIPEKMEARVGDWLGRSFFEEKKLIYEAKFNFWPFLFLSGPGIYFLQY
jgi:hypothetical protein